MHIKSPSPNALSQAGGKANSCASNIKEGHVIRIGRYRRASLGLWCCLIFHSIALPHKPSRVNEDFITVLSKLQCNQPHELNLSLNFTISYYNFAAMSLTILIAEDEPSQRQTLQSVLEREGHRVIAASNGEEAMQSILREDAHTLIDLLITDLQMPKMNGLSLIEKTKMRLPALPMIVLSMSNEMEDAVACVRAGAYDFISKPIIPSRLHLSIQQAVQARAMQREITRLKRDAAGESGFERLIGSDGGLKGCIDVGRKLAASDLPVLITGESGVGKEAYARALHGESKRSGKPFVAINCGAIPQNLAESVLFGHEKGAFTGAIAKSLGKFREASGGTLFLDEIGELAPEVQAKLLRALQNKEIEPVGLPASVPVDIRIISATHRDLADDVGQGSFREDLFYRLNVLPVHLPPLRERTQDIEPLIHFFAERLSAQEGVARRIFTPSALQTLRDYRWPGNVRELENCISRAMLLSAREEISAEDITPLLQPARLSEVVETLNTQDALMLSHPSGTRKSMDELEAEIIEKTLAFYDDHVPKSAAALNIGQSTLYRKLSQKA